MVLFLTMPTLGSLSFVLTFYAAMLLYFLTITSVWYSWQIVKELASGAGLMWNWWASTRAGRWVMDPLMNLVRVGDVELVDVDPEDSSVLPDDKKKQKSS